MFVGFFIVMFLFEIIKLGLNETFLYDYLCCLPDPTSNSKIMNPQFPQTLLVKLVAFFLKEVHPQTLIHF